MGGIRGIVLDATKIILPGASVKLQKAGSTSSQTTYTSTEGTFEFNNLANAQYTISVEMPGFQTVTSDVAVESGIRNVQIIMPAQRTVSEDVTVTGDQNA